MEFKLIYNTDGQNSLYGVWSHQVPYLMIAVHSIERICA